MPKVIIYVPQGNGKTINAQALLHHFNCSVLIDNWGIDSPVPENTLALTNDLACVDRTDITNLYHLEEVQFEIKKKFYADGITAKEG
jgi:hypothetical protein